MGALANLLNRNIGEDTNKESLARAGGISLSTLNQILGGDIMCPPKRRLQGFAKFLGISVSSLEDAGDKDGCSYGDDDKSPYNDVLRKLDEIIMKVR